MNEITSDKFDYTVEPYCSNLLKGNWKEFDMSRIKKKHVASSMCLKKYIHETSRFYQK